MKKDIHTFVADSGIFQQHKGEIVKPPSELQPLAIPQPIWIDISMDFIVGLPEFSNKSVIMVVVDLLSQYAHFNALQHPFKASMVTQVFMDNIFKLHDIQH
jgi:hypothetical protein